MNSENTGGEESENGEMDTKLDDKVTQDEANIHYESDPSLPFQHEEAAGRDETWDETWDETGGGMTGRGLTMTR